MWPLKKKPKTIKPSYTTVTLTLNSEDDFETRAENVLRASGIMLRDELMQNAIPNMAAVLESYSKVDAHAVESKNQPTENKEPEVK